MNSRILQIALRIALLKEEFAESDISEAVKLLQEQGSTSTLLAYFAARTEDTKRLKDSGRRSKSIEEQRSRSVIQLEQKDPEKFRVLSEFDSLLRKGNALPEIEDIGKVGKKLSKSFTSRSSRRDAVSKLMALLADRPIDEIKEVVENVLSSARVDESDGDYQKLAKFIITGKSPAHES